MATNPLHNTDYAVLATLLKVLRQEAGLGQTELAQRLGTKQSTVSKMETRERRVDVIELRRICDAI